MQVVLLSYLYFLAIYLKLGVNRDGTISYTRFITKYVANEDNNERYSIL